MLKELSLLPHGYPQQVTHGEDVGHGLQTDVFSSKVLSQYLPDPRSVSWKKYYQGLAEQTVIWDSKTNILKSTNSNFTSFV